MPLSLKLEGAPRDTLAISLAAILLSDSKVEITAENLSTVLESSNVQIPSYYSSLFAGYINKAGGIDSFLAGPSAGGGGGGSAPVASSSGAAAPVVEKKEEKPKEEEVDALDGGMDMFGGGGGGSDY
eukprot:gene22921-29690_t